MRAEELLRMGPQELLVLRVRNTDYYYNDNYDDDDDTSTRSMNSVIKGNLVITWSQSLLKPLKVACKIQSFVCIGENLLPPAAQKQFLCAAVLLCPCFSVCLLLL